MGFFDILTGKKKEKKGKLDPPLLDQQYHGVMGLEFAMYLSWVEDTTRKSIMGKELEKRIKMFLQKEKKIKRIVDFNKTDIMYINMVALSSDIKKIQKLRKKNKLDSRWPLMEKHIGLKKSRK